MFGKKEPMLNQIINLRLFIEYPTDSNGNIDLSVNRESFLAEVDSILADYLGRTRMFCKQEYDKKMVKLFSSSISIDPIFINDVHWDYRFKMEMSYKISRVDEEYKEIIYPILSIIPGNPCFFLKGYTRDNVDFVGYTNFKKLIICENMKTRCSEIDSLAIRNNPKSLYCIYSQNMEYEYSLSTWYEKPSYQNKNRMIGDYPIKLFSAINKNHLQSVENLTQWMNKVYLPSLKKDKEN